jgi:Collagen triple helix repeat (20 copies)
MFSTLRNRFGIPGVISVIALVFAMFGGAYAASNSSGGGKATASAKAKKGPRGPKGATGPAGPAGPQGPAGANGKDGSNGADGSAGANGPVGSNGQSVAVVTEAPGPNCANAGQKLTSATGVSYVCNGANGSTGAPGAPGAPGSPWATGGTLPTGSTEAGAWGVTASASDSFGSLAPVSFGIPLASELEEEHTIFVPSPSTGKPNPDPTHCPGTVEDPEAASGYLCVYQGFLTGSLSFLGFVSTYVSGTNLRFSASADGQISTGTWALTG